MKYKKKDVQKLVPHEVLVKDKCNDEGFSHGWS